MVCDFLLLMIQLTSPRVHVRLCANILQTESEMALWLHLFFGRTKFQCVCALEFAGMYI